MATAKRNTAIYDEVRGGFHWLVLQIEKEYVKCIPSFLCYKVKEKKSFRMDLLFSNKN